MNNRKAKPQSLDVAQRIVASMEDAGWTKRQARSALALMSDLNDQPQHQRLVLGALQSIRRTKTDASKVFATIDLLITTSDELPEAPKPATPPPSMARAMSEGETSESVGVEAEEPTEPETEEPSAA